MNPVSKNFKDVRRFTTDEVIEIGAVKLDENYDLVDEFQCYVKPEYGEITKHITKLTGITQETVADKPTFPEAFQNFIDWIGTWDMRLYSWSNSDINQLKDECRFKMPGYDISKLEKRWQDLQKAFDDRIGLHSSLALKHAIGAMNRANTAAILALLQDDEEFFRVMQPVIDLLKPKELSQSIGDLFPELGNLKFGE